jgi:hypothetical protein
MTIEPLLGYGEVVHHPWEVKPLADLPFCVTLGLAIGLHDPQDAYAHQSSDQE